MFPGAIFICHDEKGSIQRYDVKSLDLQNKKAMLQIRYKKELKIDHNIYSQYSSKVECNPLKETKVQMLEVWNEKFFSFTECPAGQLHITYGWGHIINSVYG